MNTKIQIQQVKKILYGWSLILFPLMLLLGFLMHPDLLSFAMTTTAQQLAANFRHSAMFHISHLIVTLAVPLIIAGHLGITEGLQGKGIWHGFIGAVVGIFGAFILAVNRANQRKATCYLARDQHDCGLITAQQSRHRNDQFARGCADDARLYPTQRPHLEI